MRKVSVGIFLKKLHSVASTNTFAAELIRDSHVVEGTAILADHQTRGRGQGKNVWQSEAGANLLFTIVLYPDFILAEKQFYVSMAVSNGIADFVSKFASPVKIKWPNDILISTSKVAGILIENTISGNFLLTTLIGIGLNVNQTDFKDISPNPTSLRIVSGDYMNLEDTFFKLCRSIDIHINNLYNGDYGHIRTLYLNKLFRMNEWNRFTDKSGSFEGRIIDVAESGELVVNHKSGKHQHYGFKEIEFDMNS
jgi:BirA family transcriptional regulator, biotin operon repressor / biotin---[acetyl-CoA-carboxylase] ligase